MKRLNIKITDPALQAKFEADQKRSKRGPQAEANYLFERGMELVEKEIALGKPESVGSAQESR